MTIKNLQNGSDIRGIALEGIPGETPNLGKKETILLSMGYIKWLTAKTEKPVTSLKIAVGTDSRISGPELKKYMLNTFAYCGANVLDCDMASTPAMFMSTIFDETLCDGAVMITASHLPFNRNGFKYFSKNGGLDKEDIAAIIKTAESLMDSYADIEAAIDAHSTEFESTIPKLDLIEIYANHLRSLIKDGIGSACDNQAKPLEGMKITVDAGNGAGGFFADKVLAPLGADITGSRYLEPDGTFPNHAPNPENKEAMAAACEAVIESHADFGLIFDTDVDRSAAVDGNGEAISRNEIVALAAALISDEHPGTTVVTDSVTSDHLTDFLEGSLGLKHLRFKRGYRNVINKAVELNASGTDCQLAIETSGHAAYKENYFLDDGAYLATKIVIKAALLKKAGSSLEELISSLKKPAESKEFRMKIKADDFASYGKDVLEALSSWADSHGNGISKVHPNFEGVRISFDENHGNGWALLRMSLHDPIMPLNIESDTNGGTEIIGKILKDFLSGYAQLDSSAL